MTRALREEEQRRGAETRLESVTRWRDEERRAREASAGELAAEREQRDVAEARIGDLEAQTRDTEARSIEERMHLEEQLARERERLHAAELEVARGWGEVDAMRGTLVWKIMIAYNRLQAMGRSARSLLGRAIGGTLRFLRKAVHGAFRPLGWSYLLLSLGIEELVARLLPSRRRRLDPPAPDALQTPSGHRPRVLIVSPYKVHPPDHGGGVRIFNLVRELAATCDIHLLIFNQAGDDPAQREALLTYCEGVHFHHWKPSFRPDLLGLKAPNAGLFASEDAERKIRDILQTHRLDVLQLEYTELGQFARAARGLVPVVLTEHDIARRQHQRRRKLAFHKRFPEGNDFGSTYFDWVRCSRYELSVCRRADRVLVMSEDDADFISRYLPGGRRRVRIAPNAVDTASYDPSTSEVERKGILFLGNYQNLPNVDALEYFMADIWPFVRLRHPDATLTVVGACPSPRVLRYDGQDGVSVVGPVPDLRRTYREHRFMVAPLRAGSGTRLKILEAFSSGLPVISTAIGAEGIECENGEHLLLEEDPIPFARAVERLLTDDELCEKLSRNGRALAEERYDWALSARRCLAMYVELLDGNGSPPKDGRRTAEPTRDAEQDPEGNGRARSGETPGAELVDVSVVIPTKNGGELLERCLAGIFSQEIDRSFEVVCVDSGSSPEHLERMRGFPVRIEGIDPKDFNHGLTRDLGAGRSRGEVLVFLNQDAVPGEKDWLARMVEPLFAGEARVAAVQGGIRELPDRAKRFFWDSCGERFYFTRESNRWIAAHRGIGFSTVNAAMRRSVWLEHPFGWAPIMEDKKWQQAIVEAGYEIAVAYDAFVFHTHDYGLRSLVRRCESEGYGWRTLGESYSLGSMLADMLRLRVHLELLAGIARGRVRSVAELFFPWLRPLALYRGNHFGRGVKH